MNDPMVVLGHSFGGGVATKFSHEHPDRARCLVVNSVGEPRVFVGNVMARIAMTADLSDEMSALADRGLPTLVLWSDGDGVIPMAAFDTFCSTFGSDGHVVTGGHSWLLARPDVFGQVLDNVVQI